MAKKNITEEILIKLSYLDAFSESKGEISAIGQRMINEPNDQTIKECLCAISKLKKRTADSPEASIIISSVYETLLPFIGRIKIKEIFSQQMMDSVKEESFDELYRKLNKLIGLNNVKETVGDLIAYHRVQKKRAQAGLKIPNKTLHLAFLGNPGTGKTTVARIVGKMYKELGLLSKGHFIEVSRTDLIAGYQGQTALKVKKVIEKAKGGVLFIDEAYSLTENEHSDSYGRECLTELTKALEDYRADLVVIVAGYTDLMRDFFDSNPGLKSRFNTFIEFKDYEVSELYDIFQQMCSQDDYIINDDVTKSLKLLIENEVAKRGDKFANGRFIRNLYEKIIMNQAKRLDANGEVSLEELQNITSADFPKNV